MTGRSLRRASVAALLAPLALAASACESAEEREAESALQSADRSVCLADATPVDLPDSFPAGWVFPERTTLYDVEEREGTGTILTAVSGLPLEEVLAFLNDEEVAAGFEITEGETEDDDAEASWLAGDVRGRWAIRRSASCPGETVIQTVAFTG